MKRQCHPLRIFFRVTIAVGIIAIICDVLVIKGSPARVFVGWFALGVISWGVIMRFFRPMPLVSDKDPNRHSDEESRSTGRPWSIRYLGPMIMANALMIATSPFWLAAILWLTIKNPEQGETKSPPRQS